MSMKGPLHLRLPSKPCTAANRRQMSVLSFGTGYGWRGRLPAMSLTIVDFTALPENQLAAAARVLREALAHLPSGFQVPGEAEVEVEARRNEPEWLGFAAIEQDTLV